MELTEQFFEKCEGNFIPLDKVESFSEQYPKTLPEILKVIELTDPTLEKKDLRVNGGKMDREEKGFVDIFIVDIDAGNEYALSQSIDRFNTTSYVLSKISFEEEPIKEDLRKGGLDSKENSLLKNSQIIVGEKILTAKYLAFSIGNEWFTSDDPTFRDDLYIAGHIPFRHILLD